MSIDAGLSESCGASVCGDLNAARRLEWLVTNGRGGFASASINQMLTRRYHGLLVAAIDPPVRRFVLLAKLDVTAMIDGLTYELATNDYHEAVHPHGYRLLESFSLRPFPSWRFRAGNALIEQSLCMAAGRDETFIRYRLLRGDKPVTLMARPLCTSRHFHHLGHQADTAAPELLPDGDALQLKWPGDLPPLWLSFNGEFHARPDWYYRFELAAERDRGYDYSQDLFMPGPISLTLQPGGEEELLIAAAGARCDWRNAATSFTAASESAALPAEIEAADDPILAPLYRATSDFLVARGESGKTVIAGYPWFGDWGRDTFMSLPGLCLVPGRFDDARRIIEAFAAHVSQGMIPNRFPPYGEPPAYNNVDGTLWYIHAIDRYLAYTGDQSLLTGPLFNVVAQIIDAHMTGTRHGIRVDADGLLAAGEPGHALTWMDAVIDGRAITPRIGKPVEVNALWYNALEAVADMAELAGHADRAAAWRAAAARARASFNDKFWNAERRCLFDVVDVEGQPGRNDGAIRPNQLLAISLTRPVLDDRHWRPVVELCERELWTPMGLRTLSPADPAYRPRYRGDLAARDEAYHQGTVWPWLLGPFVSAYVRVHAGDERDAAGMALGDTRDAALSAAASASQHLGAAARRRARRFLDGLLPHLNDAGIGGISEVADAEPPHTPGGCPWQAWSVAEPLRALCEDILCTHPGVPREADISTRPGTTVPHPRAAAL